MFKRAVHLVAVLARRVLTGSGMGKRRPKRTHVERLDAVVRSCVRIGKPERIAPVIAVSAELAMLLALANDNATT